MKVTRLATAPPGTPGIPGVCGVGSPPDGPAEGPGAELDEEGGVSAGDDSVSLEDPDMIGLDC